MTAIEIHEAPATILDAYATISIAFRVERVLDLIPHGDGGIGGFTLEERAVASPWVKDYDLFEGEHPLQWARGFDISPWGIFVARESGAIVGGATVAYDTPGMPLLEWGKDVALLHDIRVATDERGRGIGAALLHAAEAWAIALGCSRMKLETQNINVAACRFYERHGYQLGTINRFAYRQFPDEVLLVWVKQLGA